MKIIFRRKILIYIYNDDTSYFINHKEDDEGPTGFYFLYNYKKECGIGQFFVEGECPNQWENCDIITNMAISMNQIPL